MITNIASTGGMISSELFVCTKSLRAVTGKGYRREPPSPLVSPLKIDGPREAECDSQEARCLGCVHIPSRDGKWLYQKSWLLLKAWEHQQELTEQRGKESRRVFSFYPPRDSNAHIITCENRNPFGNYSYSFQPKKRNPFGSYSYSFQPKIYIWVLRTNGSKKQFLKNYNKFFLSSWLFGFPVRENIMSPVLLFVTYHLCPRFTCDSGKHF